LQVWPNLAMSLGVAVFDGIIKFAVRTADRNFTASFDLIPTTIEEVHSLVRCVAGVGPGPGRTGKSLGHPY